ncbi:MAG: ATP-binding protein [Methanophagales archaeon]|nr:ATP-binding protein [Methanophagales archaeon]
MRMRRTEILRILVDWNYWGNYKDESVERGRYIENLNHLLKTGEIIVIKGVRRAGKSTFMLQYVNKLGLEEKNALVVNFEDPRFKNLDLELLDTIYEVYLEELQPDKEHYVILDEVQEVEGWEKFARYLHEAKKVRVFITGSSSKLLSEEYSTLLAGRHVDIEIFPLCFREFLHFKGVSIRGRIEMIKFRHRIRKLLDEYLEFGGFPKVVLIEEEKGKEELLNNYFRDILIKDVQRRFKVRETGKLEELAKYYLTNISTPQSFNRVRKWLNLSLDTVERYSKYFAIARLIFFVPKFSFSMKEQILNPKKVYCMDTGLRNIVSFKFTEDLGRIAENVVFLNLLFRNRDKEIYYWKDHTGKEVDFVVKEGLKVNELIQACWGIEEEKTERREVRALIKAMDAFKLNQGLVITKGIDKEEEVDGKRIVYKPLWEWLLEINSHSSNKLQWKNK